jgi:hypothetical protein
MDSPNQDGFTFFRMLAGEIDAAHEMIALPYQPDLVQRLKKIHGLEKKELARHSPGRAARLGGKGSNRIAAQRLVVRCLHMFRGPRFQDRIFCVHDRGPQIPTSKTTAILTLDGIGIFGIGLHRPATRTREVELKIPEVRVPADISGTKLGNSILNRSGRGKGRSKGDRKKAGDNAAC